MHEDYKAEGLSFGGKNGRERTILRFKITLALLRRVHLEIFCEAPVIYIAIGLNAGWACRWP